MTFSPSPVPAVAAPATRRPRQSRSGQSRPVADEPGRVTELEVELQHSRATLSTTVEELETANEDLKSANEELQSTNEEVQSTIEELETSKEELQSLNEELTTVNTELQAKVDDLSRANDDMQNLLNSTDTATVFLDLELNIKRFTGQARNLIMLRQFDLGRPLSELSSKFDDSDLLRVCHQVLRTLEPLEEEVHTRDGICYLMRILPYRTANNVVSGLVLTFVDINRLKDAQTNLRRLSQVFMAAADPILIVGLDGLIDKSNEKALKLLGLSRELLLKKPLNSVFPASFQPQIDSLLTRCRRGETIRDISTTWVKPGGAEIPVQMTLTPLADDRGMPDAVALMLRQSLS
ncbi:MAG: PAS domain-containing protein [Planctomycetota bacterium]|nr:PAS domain-containing protein [Planctomycetota bacterium]